MKDTLTYEKVLELIAETERIIRKRWEESDRRFEERLKKEAKEREIEREKRKIEREKREKEKEKREKERETEREKEREKSRKEFEEKLKKGLEESRIKLDEELRQSRKEFDKKIGKITGTLGSFVEGLVEPGLLEMFRQQGVGVMDVCHNVEIRDVNYQKLAEIDLLLINSVYSVAVEVKTTLNVEGVNEHLKRLDKLQKNPKKYLKGTILLGAVAGMIIHGDADKYAYKKGLYVLKQKGEIVEIVNDSKFKPRDWIIP